MNEGPLTRRIRQVAEKRELDRLRSYLSAAEVRSLDRQRERRRAEEWHIKRKDECRD